MIEIPKLRDVKALVASFSGVMNNNQDIVGTVQTEAGPKFFKGFSRSHYDGQGLSNLRAIGTQVAFIHVDPFDLNDPVSVLVNGWNSLPSAIKEDNPWPQIKLINGVIGTGQIPLVREWLDSLGLTFADCAVMGHDLVQVPLMCAAAAEGALLMAPAQAEMIVREIVREARGLITIRRGGQGALRDFSDWVLAAKKIDPTALPTR